MFRRLKIITCMYRVSNSFLPRTSSELGQNVCYNSLQHQTVKFSVSDEPNSESVDDKKKKKPRTPRVPQITLLFPDKSMIVTYVEDAQKLAKRRNLQLEKLHYDKNVERDVYRLYGTEVFSEEKVIEKDDGYVQFKVTKLFHFSDKVAEHDLNTKINNINRVLKKRHRVKLVINFSREDKDTFIQDVKKKINGLISKEQLKKNSVQFIFDPISIEKTNDSEENVANTGVTVN
ncbi:uncharacterized protein LOC128893369 [Hylaeus anthracinus]|uniref:uncharacterized protein LOC128893369 n=1 Tax=Hylaeus anthracinus TaxID=313031 RepID=UPI0023B8EF37|nr:uncharacterized protein LOC128893369 [Hylaeus anthracinus]